MSDGDAIDPVLTPPSPRHLTMPDPTAKPKPRLLRVPSQFHCVADVLGAAAQMHLPNVVVLSELETGALVFLDSGLTMAECNWLIDRLKALMLAPDQPMRPESRPAGAA